MAASFVENKDSRRRRRRRPSAASSHSANPSAPPRTPVSPTPLAHATMDARRSSVPVIRTVGNYQLAESLGKGSMGKVKLGIHAVTGEKIAIKIVPRGNLEMVEHDKQGRTAKELAREQAHEKNRDLRTRREAHIMMLLRHPHIVSLRDFRVDARYFYILMDYVNGGQLLHYIVRRQRLSERRAAHLSRQIVSALDYLHRNSIVHRDLKIENILIDKTGRVLKLIDFGLSNLFCPERLLTTYCGSLYFAAPELLHASPYRGPEIDIWSLGVIIYVMVTGAVPFDDTTMQGLHEKIKRGHVNYPAHMSESCQDLLKRIFVTDPSDRIILADIISHRWFSEGTSAPIRSHLPSRGPITLPLNPDVIEQMAQGLDFGSPEEIRDKLELIIRSPVYQASASLVSASMASKPPTPTMSTDSLGYSPRVYNDPQSVPSAYHPLVSFYHLTRERLHLLANAEEQQPRSTLSHKISTESGLSVHSQHSHQDVNETSQSERSPRKPLAMMGNSLTHMNDVSVEYLGRIQRWLRSSVFSKIHLHEKSEKNENATPATTPTTARTSEFNDQNDDDDDDDDDDFDDQLPPTPCTPSSTTTTTPKRISLLSTRSILSSKFSFRIFLPRRTSTSSSPPSPMLYDPSLRDRPLPPLPTES